MTKRSAHILILIAFVMGVLAPACGFSWNGKFSLVEICTTEGIEMKVVENGSSPNTPQHQASDDCQFCFQNAHLIADVTIMQTAHHPHYGKIAKIVHAHEILYRQILSQYHTARGPPSFV